MALIVRALSFFVSHLGNFATSECEISVRFKHLKRSYEILLRTKKHSEKYTGMRLDSLCSQMSRLVQLFWFNNSTTKTSGIIMCQQPVSSSSFDKVAIEMMSSCINVGRENSRVEKTPTLSTIFQSSVCPESSTDFMHFFLLPPWCP